ncbi:MAG: 6-carboxytetrahydropterin synthase QueD [Lentisphaeria bacterium]|nr:6-carboxytetrahydropterin synthase QueD [Lentisphaeria bacterium]MBR7127328.1 6-carboxytetrahydropterin synthase QueD [Lentisphaeria bacterium]
MFELEISREFSAAHMLRGYNGDCSKMHGHNYGVVAVLRAKKLDEIGIAVDFKKLKANLDEILNEFDHTNLSENPLFKDINPTSEVLAMTIYKKLSAVFNSENVKVYQIKIRESATSCATYFEED